MKKWFIKYWKYLLALLIVIVVAAVLGGLLGWALVGIV